MHQDYPYFPHERHSRLAASVHLDDTDEENGCLHVVLGSHRLGPLAADGNGDGVEDHVDRGMGLMVAGSNPGFWGRRPRFRVGRHELVRPAGV